MPKNQDSLNTDLARQLKRYKPTMRDTSGKVVPVPEEAEVFQFKFTLDGEDYGTVTVSVDGLHKLVIYYNDSVADSPKVSEDGQPTWEQLIVMLKNFAQSKQLSFKLQNEDELEGDMAKREHIKKLDEGYHAMGRKQSYNDVIPETKIIIKHSRNIEEGEQRYRNVERIFIENAQGERFLAPTTKPGVAQVYARHIAEGGLPHDERWQHIGSMVEEYTKMAGFVRATRGGQFNESTQQLVVEGTNHYLKLRETLSKMRGKKGYNTYFESWTPPLMEDDDSADLSEMFKSSSLDPRIESAMPILNKLGKNISETKLAEADTLEEWANGIIEGALIPKTSAQIDDLVELLSKEKLPFGADAVNVKNELDDVLHDDDLFAQLEHDSTEDSDADAKDSIIQWMTKQNNPEFDSVLSKIENKVATAQEAPAPTMENNEKEADYGDDYQDMVSRVGKKAKEQEKKNPVDIKALAKRLHGVLQKDKTTSESLDADQKAAGQLGPTDNVSTGRVLGNKPQSQKGLRGKLVAESVDPALARIRKLSGL